MPSAKFDLIAKAIQAKTPISATYNGYNRVLNPHALGYGARGQEQVLAYQSGGESRSGLERAGSTRNWRCMPIVDLINVKLAPGEWHEPGEWGTQRQTCVQRVVASTLN